MKKFIQDSYNGIYKVLLRPYMPEPRTILLIVVGLIIGLFWAYALAPTVFYDADPSTLEQSWQDEWVKLLADRNAGANFDVSQATVQLLGAVDDPVGVIDRLLNTPGEEANFSRLQAIRPLAEQAQGSAARSPQPSLLSNIAPFIVAPLVMVILTVIVALVWGLLLKSNVYEPLLKRLRGEKVSAEVKAMREQVQAVKQAEATLRVDYSTSSLGKPVIQRMTTFLHGHGEYDDSFSVEDAAATFFGECGATVAESLSSAGTPGKPAGIEVWLFDKDDFKRTQASVFVSEYASSDPAMRARLSTRGELTLARPGATVVIESSTLRMQARLVEMQYGSDAALPPNSYFQQATIELAVWRKQDAQAAPPPAPPAPVPVSLPEPPPVQYTPPPASAPAAVFAPPPATAPARPPLPPVPAPQPVARPAVDGGLFRPPARIPPAPAPAPADDDPFGGTGDFDPN